MIKKERFTDSTFSLAKGLHHVNMAKMYFEDIRMDTTQTVKALFNQYIQKCDWILVTMKSKLNVENKIALENELSDSISFEAITDKLIRLDSSQRAFLENIMDAMIKGEEIKIIDK